MSVLKWILTPLAHILPYIYDDDDGDYGVGDNDVDDDGNDEHNDGDDRDDSQRRNQQQ